MKFRTRTEPFIEDVTIDGKTHKVERTREFRVPDAPRDWDQIRSWAGAVGTGLVVVGALAWSVVSIGSLLSALAPTWLAYTIAAVFDLAWILAMNLEHELRFEPAKQRVPKLFGWALLAVSVTVIFMHGVRVADIHSVQDVQAADWTVALAGSAIAVLAKLLWNMRVWAMSRELDEATQGWLAAEMDEAHATLAVTAQRRKIARVRARADAALRALGAEQPTEHTVEQLASTPEQPARPLLVQPSTTSAQPSSSVFTGHEQRASTPSIAEQARGQLRAGTSQADAVASILRARPDAKPAVVKAEVRRQAKKLNELTGQYL